MGSSPAGRTIPCPKGALGRKEVARLKPIRFIRRNLLPLFYGGISIVLMVAITWPVEYCRWVGGYIDPQKVCAEYYFGYFYFRDLVPQWIQVAIPLISAILVISFALWLTLFIKRNFDKVLITFATGSLLMGAYLLWRSLSQELLIAIPNLLVAITFVLMGTSLFVVRILRVLMSKK